MFKGEGQLVFFGGGGLDSWWVANSLSHCCQIRVLELSNLKRERERKCRTRALKKRMCSAHGGSSEMHTEF